MIDDQVVNLPHRKPFACISEWTWFKANLGQISILSMQIVENPRYSFPPLLQPLHS